MTIRAWSRNSKGTFAGTFVPPPADQTRLSWHRGEDDVDSVHQERQDYARVDLYRLPLGAGDASGCVHWNGRSPLRGRAYTEPPDITARICGICR